MRHVETDFAFDIGDVVRLKTWNYTSSSRLWGWETCAPAHAACVYQIIELLVQVCEGGLQRKYAARSSGEAGSCTREYVQFVEGEIELAEKLPKRPEKPIAETTNTG